MNTALITIILSLALSTPGLACSFNTDCEVGSKCMKQRGQLEGVCVGGLFPGKSEDERSKEQNQNPYNWKRDRGSEGNRCSFTTDCDVGQMCLKESGRLYGVCL